MSYRTYTGSAIRSTFVGSILVLASPAIGQLVEQDTKLLAQDGTERDSFGYSIAVHDGLVAVGAIKDDDNGTDSGSAYLFVGATGVEFAKLLPDDGASFDNFGFSIAMDQGVVAVGARNDSVNGAFSGSVYLFDANTGNQTLKLLPLDGAAGDEFGFSVSISNGIVVVGAPKDDDLGEDSGSVYLFDASTGIQINKLLPDDGVTFDYFGFSVDIDNEVIVVGAYSHDAAAVSSGAAYLFDVTSGNQNAKLLPDDGGIQDQFGISVAIADNVVVVGANQDGDNGGFSGSAYLFNAATGIQEAKLLANDGEPFDDFGRSVDTDGEIVLVGATGDDDAGNAAGAVYLFSVATGTQFSKFIPSDAEANISFGWSLSIDEGGIAAGARFDNDNGIASGSAYVLDVDCPVDFNGDFFLNFFDVVDFIALLSAQDPSADLNGDGLFNFFDVSAFLTAFGSGCP